MRIYYLLLLLGFSLHSTAQGLINLGYSLGVPREDMGNNIKSLHSLNAGYSYRLPGKLDRIITAVEFSGGDYATTRKLQSFNFGSGGATETWVNYSSSVMQYAISGRVELLKEKNFSPYIYGKAGYACFFSSIFIEDPDDPAGCKALEQKTLIKDGTMMTGYGGGLGLNLALFSKNKEKKECWIDVQLSSIRGGNLEYINTKKLMDPTAPQVSGDGKALNVKFINVSTNEIHEHQVAEVYSTPLRMLELKVSCRFRLTSRCMKNVRSCN